MNPWMNQPVSLWQGDPRAAMMLDWFDGRVSAADIEKWAAAQPAKRATQTSDGLGIVALQGIVMRRPGIIESLMGAVSLDGFMQGFRALAADPAVSTILMLIDSPGGEILGVPEAAAEIRAARSQKRVVAMAEDMAASAAYWIASQADEIVVTPSGGAGAIEVYMVHTDVSAALEQAGVKREVIAGGPNKQHGASGFALSDEDRAHAQSQADTYYEMYAADVAKGRAVSVKDVTGGYGQGRYLLAKQAKAAGMVDRIDTLDSVLRREMGARAVRSMAALNGSATMTGTLSVPNGTVTWGEADQNGQVTGELVMDDLDLANAEVVDETGEPDEPAAVPSAAFELELRRRRAAAR